MPNFFLSKIKKKKKNTIRLINYFWGRPPVVGFAEVSALDPSGNEKSAWELCFSSNVITVLKY
jgi:hypothetical protein